MPRTDTDRAELLRDTSLLLDLPPRNPDPAPSGFAFACTRFDLPQELHAALTRLAGSREVSVPTLLTAALAWLLHRHTGQESLCLGVEPADGRAGEVVVLRSRPDGAQAFAAFLAGIDEDLSAGRARGGVPLAEIALGLSAPLEALVTLREGAAGPEVGGPDGPRLHLAIGRAARGWAFALSGDLPDGQVEAVGQRLVVLLESVARAPEAPLAELDWITPEERRRVLVEWNETGADFPQDRTLAQLFEERARRNPEAPALAFEASRMSYGELNRSANRLARRLQALGVGPGAPVGVCVERSLEMVVGILAILKAGGAYVPLDPDYPAERLAGMVEDAGPVALLTLDHLAGRLPAFAGPVLSLDRGASSLEGHADHDLPPASQAGDPAYVIFTSGSTGRPKGVVTPHRAVARLVINTDYLDVRPSDVLLQLSPLSFDAATLEIWGSLLNGATLAIHPPGRIDPREVAGSLRSHGVTILWLTAALFDEFTLHHLDSLRGLRCLLAGGDVLPRGAIRRALAGLPDTRLINGYGPTETTTFATTYPFPRDWDGSDAPIGRPIANTRAFILDEGLRPVPPGVAGELYVGGVGLALGYAGRPDLTAERFIPDPFNPGERLYRTGDRARFRQDGIVEFLGRLDGQVKLRGFRIEPGEIEAAMLVDERVAQAVVLLREDDPGDRRLVAYAVPAAGAVIDPVQIRARLAARLPEYMIPAAVVVLERLPVTPNGKVDRRALPRPIHEAAVGTPPATPTEIALAGLWGEILNRTPEVLEDDFLDLGGHSLLLGRLAARLRGAFGVEVPLGSLYRATGLGEMAALIDAGAPASGAPPAPPPLLPRSGGDPIPLSFPQERIWFIEQVAPGNLAYQMQATIRLEGPLDPDALAGALTEIVRRHEVFRTAFREVDGAPVQVILDPYEIELPILDQPAGSGDFDAWAREVVAREVTHRYRLEEGRLARWMLLRASPTTHVLLHCEHHLIHDGWSLSVFLDELGSLYEAFAEGRPSPLAPPLRQFADLAVWQRRWMEGSAASAYLAHWGQRLAGLPAPLDLAGHRPRPPAFTFRGSALRTEIPPDTYGLLRRGAREHDVTLFTLMLSGFFVLLSRYADQRDLVVGVGTANRRLAEAERVIGMVINTLPLRVRLDDDPSFAELLARVHATAVDGYTWADVPLDRLIEALGVARDPSRNPLFSTIFSFHDAAVPDLSFGGLDARLTIEQNGSAKADINIIVIPRAEQRAGRAASPEDQSLTLIWEYCTDLFDEDGMRDMLDAYLALLRSALSSPDAPVSRIPLAAGEEPDEAAPPSGPIELFERWVRARPAVLAVDDPAGRSLTFAELDREARRLARRQDTADMASLPPGADLAVALVVALRLGKVAGPGAVTAASLPALAAALDDVALPVSQILQIAPTGSEALAVETWAALLGGRTLRVSGEVAQRPASMAALLGALGDLSDTGLVLPGELADALAARSPDALAGLGGVVCLGPGGGRRLAEIYPHAVSAVGAPGAPVIGLAQGSAFRGPLESMAAWTGYPAPGLSLVVRDRAGAALPDGVPGEIRLRLPGDPGERSTGWAGRRLRDGRMQVLGPAWADPVAGGFRVSLPEVRAVLEEHPDVAQAAVRIRAERLEAYLTPRTDVTLTPAQVRTWLAGRIAPYQMPASITVMRELPLDAFGRLDAAALPEPDGEPIRLPREPSPTEAEVGAICARLLGLAEVDPEADFFLLGGRSLLAIRLVSHVNQAFGVQVPVARFLQRPTVAGLAAGVEDARVGGGPLAPKPSARRNAAELLANLDRLTDAEVQDLLKELR